MEQSKKQDHNPGYWESRLASSGLRLEESHGLQPWREKGSMRAELIFKGNLFQAHESSIPTIRKWNKGGRRPIWMSKEVLTKLAYKEG